MVGPGAGAGLFNSPGTTTIEKYGTVTGSTSRTGITRCAVVEARSTYHARSATPAASRAASTLGNVRPSFMMATASLSRSRRTNSSAAMVPGSTTRVSSPSTSGLPTAMADALTDVTPGMISVSNSWARRLCMCM